MSTNENAENGPANFNSVVQADVPKGRDGKHKQIVLRLIRNITQLKPGTALKIPLSELPDSKENIRSALNRATRQQGLDVATASDEDHLYIWKTDK
jgi:TusA-related sulfurtransferase